MLVQNGFVELDVYLSESFQYSVPTLLKSPVTIEHIVVNFHNAVKRSKPLFLGLLFLVNGASRDV